MSKMSELSTALDDLTEVGRRLVTCGEDLIRAAARVKDCISDDGAEAQSQQTVKAQEAAKEAAKETAYETAKGAEKGAPPEPPASKTYTKEEVRAMLASLSQSGFRAEAKALVKKYSDGGSLTDIDPANYPELVKEAEQYHV